MDLDLALIDEDPQQPRTEDNPGFSESSLNELAASIRLRGIKTPISVRESPGAPGRFIINHGARRTRSSRIAGKSTIPGFVDNDYNEADQVIENLQRNALTPREVANFIGRELAKGLKKGEIALAISKSPAFVTQHANLLDLPDIIADAFNSGRVKDVTVVSELIIAHKKYREQVGNWLRDGNQEITRGSVKLLREFLSASHGSAADDWTESTTISVESNEDEIVSDVQAVIRPEVHSRLKKPVLQIRHVGRHAYLLLHRPPTTEGLAWLRYEDTGEENEVKLSDVTLLALLDS
ncbi:MAG: ParB/RepB/Spo0J family partition protein [Pseudomonadota bacterium]